MVTKAHFDIDAVLSKFEDGMRATADQALAKTLQPGYRHPDPARARRMIELQIKLIPFRVAGLRAVVDAINSGVAQDEFATALGLAMGGIASNAFGNLTEIAPGHALTLIEWGLQRSVESYVAFRDGFPLEGVSMGGFDMPPVPSGNA